VTSGDKPAVQLHAEYVMNCRVESVGPEEGEVTVRTLFGPGTVKLGTYSLPWKLKDEAYVAVRNADGRLVRVKSAAPAPAAQTGDFAVVFHDVGFGTLFPREEVGKGDEWRIDLENEPPVFQPEPDELRNRAIRGDYRGAVKAIEMIAGEPAVTVHGRLNMVVTSDAGTVSSRATTDVVLDAKDGWPLRATGRITVYMEAPGGAKTWFDDIEVKVRIQVPRDQPDRGAAGTPHTEPPPASNQ
jgi:hypothetical protein